jgi:hypothetical protein
MFTQTTAQLQKNLKGWIQPNGKTNVSFEHKFYSISDIRKYLYEDYSPELVHFLSEHVNLNHPEILVTNTTTRFNILKEPYGFYSGIVNLKRINDIRYLNKFFETVNDKLPVNGTFIGCVETKNLRKERILKKYPPGLNYIYYTLDFILKRIFPKLPVTKKIYFFLTRGNNRVLTRSETLGRLVACGFNIEEQETINGHLYFVARKIKPPLYPENPTYGLLVRLNRVGKNGKNIRVLKLRTMHPFSEYLQDYVYKQNNLEQNGKFKDDFRLCTVGKFLRKFWLDELPMLINIIKGDLKLVGVRPISPHYYSLYPEELQKKRIRFKPGLFPPFYADLPKTFDEIVESELRYLEAYEKHPLRTDLLYFRKAFCNIVFRCARSS